ncbi:erbin-like isoform X2 [Palaemon carinicauda]|uniref:erbin-like isoform X2 n=1 Tax=Palaemon carinicauda TaxID=392227 RepID=UPI0035B64E05
MPSLFSCLGCGGGAESDDIRVLDYRHAALTDVPSDVFASERTLEELLLDSNQLSELPRQLFYCHGLKELGLSDNELTSLPPAVASLINLVSIDLSKNAISDIPDNIKGCKQLSVVDASINPLCRLPEGFTQLLSLQELYLNDTFLEYLPANFGRLSRLRILELRENQLNTLPKSMARLTNLQRLDIGQNDFSELPEVIGSLGNLTELWFDNNKVKSLPPLMGRLKKLVHVDASKNKVDWVTEELENCTQLTDLHLSSNYLKELPEKFGGCRQLQVLRLDDNALTHLPESIGGLVSLEELVVTQNDLETLPASIGLLRALHTLHMDDNLLTELPPELGSCSRLTVLTAASNRLTSVPAELGHLPQLAVLNLCANLIHHLPVSLTKLKLRALWLSENQNKPQVQLQSETLPETGQRVLTCFMLPQQQRSYQPEAVVEADNFPGQGWEEQRKAKTLIKFAFDGDVDKPGRLTRAPTPYPKELKALAKHARNLNSLQKDTARQFVLGRTPDSNKVSASSVVTPAKEELEMEPIAKETYADVKQPLLAAANTAADQSNSLDDSRDAEDSSLTVVEPQMEERPLLREARNVRNTPISSAANSMNGDVADTTHEQPYAIGDRKVFGHAQVVAVNHSVEKQPNEASKISSSGEANVTANISDKSPVLPQHTSALSAPEGESASDSPDKRIKKPPPYHIAAVMSRHAADFQEATVEVPSSPRGVAVASGLTVKDLPSRQTSSAIAGKGTSEEETVDTSSSSDSGYGNGKSISQQISEELTNDNVTAASSPTSPQNTDSNFTMPSTPSSPLSPSSPGPLPDLKSNGSLYSVATSQASPFSNMYRAGDRHSHAGIQQSKTTSPLYSSQQLYSSQMSSYVKPHPFDGHSKDLASTPSPYGRPASIATGAQLEKQMVGLAAQRPGSLALGHLADSALLNRLPQDQRPGSLAAPINTVGIPPAPTRAMSYMGLNVSSPTKQRDLHMYRSQDILGSSPAQTQDHQNFGGVSDKRQESNGLVSIIDQVTSSILEHGESPPPKVSVTSSSLPSATVTMSNDPPSLQYSQSTSLSHNTSVGLSTTTTTTSSESSGTSVSGLTNFTQDQPRGEVLHPTPHRPNLIASSPSKQEEESVPQSEPAVQTTSENNVSPPKTGPKPLSRIPSRSSDVHSGHNNHNSHLPSRAYNHSESRLPAVDNKARDTNILSSESHGPVESRIPSLSSSGRSKSSLSQAPKGLTESQIPMVRPTNFMSSQNKSVIGDSRIPAYGNNRSSDNMINSPQFNQEPRKPFLANAGRSSSSIVQESQTGVESRIPVMAGMVRSSSNLGKENLSSSKLPTSNAYGPTGTNQVGGSSLPTNNMTGIPTLASQGRSNSGLGSGIPLPGSVGLRNEAPKNIDVRKPLSQVSASHISTSSRLQTPGYAGGIRPPSMHTSSPVLSTGKPHQPSQMQPPGYTCGLRPPSVNAAINTPGIPIPSSTSSSSYLNNPGSRSSVSSTGSGSRIPMTSGLSSSRLPAPASTKLRTTPASPQSPDGGKNSTAWMFGQHKNARVFPVVIEKNPDLGFTIGQSEEDPEDKSIYVVSVAGGGAASSALKVGDKLLQVDGADVRSANLHTAVSILNKTANTVNLMVSRLQ